MGGSLCKLTAGGKRNRNQFVIVFSGGCNLVSRHGHAAPSHPWECRGAILQRKYCRCAARRPKPLNPKPLNPKHGHGIPDLPEGPRLMGCLALLDPSDATAEREREKVFLTLTKFRLSGGHSAPFLVPSKWSARGRKENCGAGN